jgi:hypothetical protein
LKPPQTKQQTTPSYKDKTMKEPKKTLILQEAELALLEWLDLALLTEEAQTRLDKALSRLQPMPRAARIALRVIGGEMARHLTTAADLTRQAIDRANSGPPELKDDGEVKKGAPVTTVTDITSWNMGGRTITCNQPEDIDEQEGL